MSAPPDRVSVAVVVGNLKPRSRTWQAAHRVARELTGRTPEVDVDLADLGARLLDPSDPAVRDVAAAVRGAGLVVVASPTYKATYTGLLKLFLEQFGAGELAGTEAVALMLGGHWRHALAPEVHLKPVLSEIGAAVPAPGLFLLDSEWDRPDALDSWLLQARAAHRFGVPS